MSDMSDYVVEVAGRGFFSLGFAGPEALAAGQRDEAVQTPPTTLGSRRHLRYTSSLTRMSISVYEQAVKGSDLEPPRVNVIFGSSQGEVQIAVELLEKVATEGGASPARFMNSVHNTVTGHLSIATKSHNGFSALAGCEQTVSAVITEGYCLLASGDADNVVLIAADEALPKPLDLVAYDGLAMALLLRRVRRDQARHPIIAGIHLDPSVDAATVPERHANLVENPCAPALGVLDALAAGRAGVVRLDGAGGSGWCMELSAPGGDS